MYSKLLLLVSIVITHLFAIDVIVTSNIDANISIAKTNGTEQVQFDIIGSKEKIVSLDWANENSSVSVVAQSQNALYSNKSFDSQFRSAIKLEEPWVPKVYSTDDKVSYNGKNWRAKWYASATDTPSVANMWEEDNSLSYFLDITLDKRTNLSPDTAYIPFQVNRKVTVKATPISLIDGSTSDPQTFILEPSRLYTLTLPIKNGSTPITTNVQNSKQNIISYNQLNGSNNLILPTEYKNGKLTILSINGRQIAHADLTSSSLNRLSVWNVSPGIYLLQVVSPNGQQFTQKITHNGGDITIKTLFKTHSNTATTKRITRGATASYKFDIDAEEYNYTDTSLTINIDGKENSSIIITLQTHPAPIEELLDEETYNKIFPHRFGINDLSDTGDFYSYEAFKEAIVTLADYKATVYTKDRVGGDRVVVEYKDGSTNTYYTIESYDQSSNPETYTYVDYSTLLNWGPVDSVKYELVAMLAHMASETTGRSPGASDQWEYGLYFVHEAGLGDNTVGEYFSPHGTYPPDSTQSYHGRGPKQISYNYNYGQFSDFLYADKNILLHNPNLVSRDPVISFMSSLWFWMTPQGEKPSCHAIMSGDWVPTAEDTTKGRAISKFGMTTNVINGGVECGGSFSEINNEKRLGHYNFFATEIGIVPEDELSCKDIQNYSE